MAISDRLQALLEPIIDDLGYELVGVEYLPNPKNRVVRVFIDHEPDGIGVEDCERVSREVSALMDVEEPVPGQYTLEVSSPGVERPLFTGAHFARFVGETASVQMAVPIDNRRRFKGVIVAADDRTVTLEVDGQAVELAVADMVRAHLAPDLEALFAARHEDNRADMS
ncbi:ribosome maturation factor RimP [Wenzhouxiangella limi]|uniref:Ribosome maturation factor RimP n=1 Tax=Wenzhouxiangella limi TaxID=2707351 RepID=A0A845UXI5_9GAMM|nr:ribosome maturation factor RimP [Wenzhouxiangella limi]NDY96573.1 ribosome maturation factor RimP [Wenzhouxiangella limi]